MRTWAEGETDVVRQPEGRFGRLAAPAWSDGFEVRCACDDCGAHLLAAPGLRGALYGVCLVCGGESFTPVI